MKTTEGLQRVDVLYRRIDDDFLDPLVFRSRHRCWACRDFSTSIAPAGVTIVNAPGSGLADDKAIYSYIPEIIEFYTGKPPILRNVPKLQLPRAGRLTYVIEHLAELVVKEVHGSGGYGMLVGPTSTTEQIETFRAKLLGQSR